MSDDLTRAIAEALADDAAMTEVEWGSTQKAAERITAALAPLIEARVREARAHELVRLVTKAKAWHTAQDLCALAIQRAQEIRDE